MFHDQNLITLAVLIKATVPDFVAQLFTRASKCTLGCLIAATEQMSIHTFVCACVLVRMVANIVGGLQCEAYPSTQGISLFDVKCTLEFLIAYCFFKQETLHNKYCSGLCYNNRLIPSH